MKEKEKSNKNFEETLADFGKINKKFSRELEKFLEVKSLENFGKYFKENWKYFKLISELF